MTDEQVRDAIHAALDLDPIARVSVGEAVAEIVNGLLRERAALVRHLGDSNDCPPDERDDTAEEAGEDCPNRDCEGCWQTWATATAATQTAGGPNGNEEGRRSKETDQAQDRPPAPGDGCGHEGERDSGCLCGDCCFGPGIG